MPLQMQLVLLGRTGARDALAVGGEELLQHLRHRRSVLLGRRRQQEDVLVGQLLTDQLVSYALDLSFEDLPAGVVHHTKQVILDTVGCALGGTRSEPARIAAAVAAGVTAARPATLLVSGQPTSPDLAALVNGIMVRYQDFNDTYLAHALCHPSDMFAPVLAAVEAGRGSGRDLILGVVLGYELYCSVVDASAAAAQARGQRHGSGFDQAAFGVIGAAIAAGRLLGLGRDQLAHALSLAVVSHLTLGQARLGQLSHWKGGAVPNAGRNAIVCALLAAQGMTGPEDVFEGPSGYFEVVAGPFAPPPFGGQGGRFRILDIIMKPVPAGYMCATAVEAVAQVRSQVPNFHVQDVKALRLHTYQVGMNYAGEVAWEPQTRETADHSLPYIMAMTLLDGELTIAQYEQQRYLDADVRQLMSRITVDVTDEATRVYPDQSLNTVELEMESGAVYHGQCAYQLGHPKRPFSDAEQERKFRSMAEGVAGLEPAATTRLMAGLRELDRLDHIDGLLSLTIPRSR